MMAVPQRRRSEPDVPRPVARAAQKAQAELLGNRAEAGKNFINEAAALEQADELLAEEGRKAAENEAARAPGDARRGNDDPRGAERHVPSAFAADRSLAQRSAAHRSRPDRNQARVLLQGGARF